MEQTYARVSFSQQEMDEQTIMEDFCRRVHLNLNFCGKRNTSFIECNNYIYNTIYNTNYYFSYEFIEFYIKRSQKMFEILREKILNTIFFPD